MKILVVDDEPQLIDLVKELLESVGHIVVTAENGKVALEKVFSENNAFDLILSDYNMPIMSGIDLYKAIRRNCTKNFIPPFILITANIEDALSEKGISKDDFYTTLSKPFPLDSIEQIIKTLETKTRIKNAS